MDFAARAVSLALEALLRILCMAYSCFPAIACIIRDWEWFAARNEAHRTRREMNARAWVRRYTAAAWLLPRRAMDHNPATVYHPFFSSVQDRASVIENRVAVGKDGEYRMDLEHLGAVRRRLQKCDSCFSINPVGRFGAKRNAGAAGDYGQAQFTGVVG